MKKVSILSAGDNDQPIPTVPIFGDPGDENDFKATKLVYSYPISQELSGDYLRINDDSDGSYEHSIIHIVHSEPRLVKPEGMDIATFRQWVHYFQGVLDQYFQK